MDMVAVELPREMAATRMSSRPYIHMRIGRPCIHSSNCDEGTPSRYLQSCCDVMVLFVRPRRDPKVDPLESHSVLIGQWHNKLNRFAGDRMEVVPVIASAPSRKYWRIGPFRPYGHGLSLGRDVSPRRGHNGRVVLERASTNHL